MWLREDSGRVSEWESEFQAEACLEQAHRSRKRLVELGLTPLAWPLWPLRPFFFETSLWQQVGHRLSEWIQFSAEHLPSHSFPVDWAQCRCSPYWDALMRPDLFLHQDRVQLLELNFGNGSLLAQAYVDGLMRSQGRNPGVLESYLDWLESQFQPGPLSLLASAQDWETLQSDQSLTFPPVLAQILDYLEGRLRERGWQPLRQFDPKARAILPLTIGYDLDLREFQGADWKGVPILVPFSSLAWEKSVLPWLWENCAQERGGLELPKTLRSDDPEVRSQRQNWVLKRAREGKHTLIGATTSARRWNRALESDPSGYIAQLQQQPPRCRLPISPDGQSVEWKEVAVEVSPFFLNYRCQGALVRWAPTDHGQLFSPPDARVGVGFAL
jgi:hypothetical protein